jgi:hypothetical protein
LVWGIWGRCMQEGSAMPAGGRLPRSRFLEAVPHPQVSQYFLFYITALLWWLECIWLEYDPFFAFTAILVLKPRDGSSLM